MCDRVAEAAVSVDMRPDGCFWVAYSGGLDSTVLMRAAFEVFGPKRCRAVHINHGLSPKANEWQSCCEKVAAAMGVSIKVVRAELEKGNEELAGRRARYGIWKRLIGDGDVVATAHHADDVAETRLWQLFSGRSPIGIPSNRPLGEGHVVRPFLDLNRRDLESFATRHELSWIEDESNFDTAYDRNWIRQTLLPLVGSRFRHAAHHLAKMEWPELPLRQARPLDLDATNIDDRALREWLWAYGVVPTRGQLNELRRQIRGPENCSVRVEIRNDYSIRGYRRQLHVVRDFEPQKNADILVGKEWGDSNGTLTWVQRETGVALGHGLSLRSRQGGERIRFGGKNRSLAEIYRSHGIPPWLRESMPLLFDHQDLVAIPGLALADSAKVSSGWWPEWHCSIEVE